VTSSLPCYCIEEDCTLMHAVLPAVDEFSQGRCVDCGMSVPEKEIICVYCKDAWQAFSVSGNVGRPGEPAVQPGDQKLQGQD
jgi:hypothetical protein